MTKKPPDTESENKVRVFGQRNSPEAYAIRDFLSRSLVEYDLSIARASARAAA